MNFMCMFILLFSCNNRYIGSRCETNDIQVRKNGWVMRSIIELLDWNILQQNKKIEIFYC
jgi:hypothetical protein